MKRTLEEYKAQAMLLGMFYDKQINTFYQWISETDPTTADLKEVDADTMEPLTDEQITERQQEWKRRTDIKSSDDFAPSARLP